MTDSEIYAERSLWCEVIKRAINDLRYAGCHEASSASFFLDQKQTLALVCQAAGVDPDRILLGLDSHLARHRVAHCRKLGTKRCKIGEKRCIPIVPLAGGWDD